MTHFIIIIDRRIHRMVALVCQTMVCSPAAAVVVVQAAVGAMGHNVKMMTEIGTTQI